MVDKSVVFALMACRIEVISAPKERVAVVLADVTFPTDSIESLLVAAATLIRLKIDALGMISVSPVSL